MKKLITLVILFFIIGIIADGFFNKPGPPEKSKTEIRLEKENKALTKKMDLNEIEKEEIFKKYLKEKEKKPVIIIEEKIITKEIDSELWVKKELYDSVVYQVFQQEKYTRKVENAFELYRSKNPITIKLHKEIIAKKDKKFKWMKGDRDKYYRISKRRISFGFHTGMNTEGHFNISAGLNFRIK